MARHRFVGVTYGEFQSLYLHGRMQAPSARLVPLGIRRDGRPSRQAKDVSRLIASLPELTLDDQEGVLILDLGPGRIARDVLARDIQQVIPATARARRILEPRLEPLGVDLAQPHFEAAVLERWSQRNAANALDGGRALCDLLFEDGVSVGVPLQEAAEAAIRHLDRQDDRGTDAGVSSWVPAAFQFTRHDPYDHGNVNYLMDAGQILGRLSWPPGSDAIERCRELVRGMIKRQSDGAVALADILRGADVRDLAVQLERATDRFPAGLGSLVLFCRWKECFHKWREGVDVEALAKEAGALVAGDVDFRSVAESLWLLGCFAGHERVAHPRYAADADAYPWFSGPALSLSRIRRPAPAAASGEVAPETSDGTTTTAATPAVIPTQDGRLPLAGSTATAPDGAAHPKERS